MFDIRDLQACTLRNGKALAEELSFCNSLKLSHEDRNYAWLLDRVRSHIEREQMN
jgi:hypothetical protein